MRLNLLQIALPFVAFVLMGASCSSSTKPTSEAAAPAPATDAIVFDFEKDGEDKVADGFTAALTGRGGPVTVRVPTPSSSSPSVITPLAVRVKVAAAPLLTVTVPVDPVPLRCPRTGPRRSPWSPGRR